MAGAGGTEGAGVAPSAGGAAGAGAGDWFVRCYGREPEGIWFAPGRVNLIGGPDYNEVFVLPFALGAGVYAAAARRGDGRIALASRQAGGDPVLLPIGALAPGSVGGWAAYPAGVAWALREADRLAGGADAPSGTSSRRTAASLRPPNCCAPGTRRG